MEELLQEVQGKRHLEAERAEEDFSCTITTGGAELGFNAQVGRT